MRWLGIKERARKSSPPRKLGMLPRFKIKQLRQRKQRPKTFLPFNRARKTPILIQPRSEVCVDRVRFLVRKSLGPSRFLALIAEHLVVRRRGVHQAFPLLLSHRRYHPYWPFFLITDTIHTGSIIARTRLWI